MNTKLINPFGYLCHQHPQLRYELKKLIKQYHDTGMAGYIKKNHELDSSRCSRDYGYPLLESCADIRAIYLSKRHISAEYALSRAIQLAEHPFKQEIVDAYANQRGLVRARIGADWESNPDNPANAVVGGNLVSVTD